MPQDQDIEILKRHIEQLGEHFDSVQIFVTRHEIGTDDGTVGCSRGIGNWYARVGQVSEWLRQLDEGTRIDERKRNED